MKHDNNVDYLWKGEEVGDCNEGETQCHIGYIPKYDQTSVVLVESNDASPKPVIRGINKDKRTVPRYSFTV